MRIVLHLAMYDNEISTACEILARITFFPREKMAARARGRRTSAVVISMISFSALRREPTNGIHNHGCKKEEACRKEKAGSKKEDCQKDC